MSDLKAPRDLRRPALISLVVVAVVASIAAVLVMRSPSAATDPTPSLATVRPSTPPSGLQWSTAAFDYGEVWVPLTAEGPRVTEPRQWSGWSQSPEGAAAAAAAIYAGLRLNNAAADEYLASRVSGPPGELDYALIGRPEPGELPPLLLRPYGWRVERFDGTTARAVVAYEEAVAGDGAFMIIYEMVWEDGDWKMVWSGSTVPALRQPDGEFVTWGPS